MHYVSIIVTAEQVTCSAHVCRELKHLVKAAIGYLSAQQRISQVTDDKIIGSTIGKFGCLEVDAADLESFIPEAVNEVIADETTGPTNKSVGHCWTGLLMNYGNFCR